MSRLIVKNLPLSITDAKLKTSFSNHGTVTDLQLKYNKQGKFRGFGFVGFKTEEEGTKAKEYLDGTYIGAAKIKVEFCNDLGDKKKEEKDDKFKDDTVVKKTEISTGADKHKDDVKFQEFMKIHNKNGAWGNENLEATAEVEEKENKEEEKENEEVEAEDTPKVKTVESDLDYLKTKTVAKEKKNIKLYTIKLTGLPYKFKKKDLKSLLAPLKPASMRVPPKIRGIAFAGFSTEKEQNTALNKHKSFVSGNQIQVIKYEDRSPNQESGDKLSNSKWAHQEAELANTETIGESGRIFVRNLPYGLTEDDLSELFSKYGPLTETNVPVDRLTRKTKGFAFITFMMPEHAVSAFSALDGTTVQGRLLHLLPAKAAKQEDDNKDDSKDSFKKAKEAKLKSSAGSSHNWNSLFLGGSAVADVLAEQYGVDKAQVLLDDGKGGNTAAVKLALGETQIVEQTRTFLEDQGVKLDVFNRRPDKRSKTVILAKNLPAKTSPEEIRDLFSKFGVVDRMVMPPHSLCALIEFAEASEARLAFTKLAYTKFHSTPLYLEWAPDDTFVKPAEKPQIVIETSVEHVDDKKDVKKEDKKGEVPIDDEPEDGSTLFIKNLNFSTTDDPLVKHFEGCGRIASANVAIKKNTNTGETLSMGFGFVTFQTKASAEKALKTLQHSRLDDHCLELKRSNRASTKQQESEDSKKKSVGKPSTKLLVRNIPFQATKQEITEIFKTFGELTAVRLPKKMAGTGDHRGFAFIEFGALADAKAAFKSLVHSTHLYGRRMVLEWASEETSIEEMRDKTSRHWTGLADGKNISKKMKMDIQPSPKEDD